MILLWGLPDDGPLRAVQAVLRARREPFGLLNQHRIGRTAIDLVAGAVVHGTLRLDDMSIALEAIDAAYVRPYDIRQVPAMREAGPSSMLWHHGLALEDALRAWVEIAPSRIVNRPSAMSSNGSKPYQAALIQAAGFDVPDTLVTTDPLAALAFRDRHGSIIYKSISSVRSIVSRLDEERLDRLADIGNCPTQSNNTSPEPIFGCTSLATGCSPPRSDRTRMITAIPAEPGRRPKSARARWSWRCGSNAEG